MKVLLWGWIGYNNFGDDAMLKIIYDKVRQQSPTADIIAFSSSKESTKKVLKDDIKIYPRTVKKLLKEIPSSNVLIITGGTLFPFPSKFKLFCFSFLTFAAKMFGVKVAYLNIGCTELLLRKGFYKLCIYGIIVNSEYFITRQTSLFNYIISNFGPRKNVSICSDIVFGYEGNLIEPNSSKLKKKCVVSLTNIFDNVDSAVEDKFIDLIAEFFNEKNRNDEYCFDIGFFAYIR